MTVTNIWHGLQPGVSRLADLQAALGHAGQITEGAMYGHAGPYQLYAFAAEIVSVFLKNGLIMLMVIAVPADKGFPPTESAWRETVGAPQDYLPSRLGKNHHVMVYARRGVAVHVAGGKAEIVELFPPMAPSEYKKTLYSAPPEWRK